MTAPPWLDVLDDTVRACATHRRPDLAQRLRERRAQLLDGQLRVLVLGEAGQGKSQLVNALVNAPVCATGDDQTTTVPAVVRHADRPAAVLVTEEEAGEPPALEATAGRRTVPIESATALANGEPAGGVLRAEVGLPRKLLSTGLALIDTPSAPDPTTLPPADATLLVSDATRELSAGELDLLAGVVELCPTVVVVLTKIDLVPNWRRVAERNRARLARDGLRAPVVPVSANLRLAAARDGDRVLATESGFGELIRLLRQDLAGQAELLARRSVTALAGLAVEQLVEQVRAEYTATQHADTGELTARWHAASRELERLQRESARWQTLLSDEVADLTSDVEFDLRERTRRILHEVDDYFDVADPAKNWPEFAEWLRENLTTVAETNSGWLLDRFDWIARRLSRLVARDTADAPSDSAARDGALDHVGELRMPAVERFGIGQKLFVGMRGSYSGLLMFGLASTVAGLTLINPISIGAGVAFGAKSVFEERGNRLKRRQSAAKNAAHRYVDDFFLGYGKHSKDTTRLIHRALRDRFAGVAEELRAEISESAKGVKRLIDAEATERAARAQRLKLGMDELTLLRRRVHALGTVPGARRELTA
ncbi:dynamin family protein [Amycolatopsis cihanbeyliensis]|uniref:Dynamin family protein n=1 Tax=Amycolatopsis cihanbeyliensis TaxID=1128664 RepID=A0A542DML6_AMYCI|nr:dynamin family protein [Amycolatopsis cihanbeyliensis]TQJ04333.1 dynamin family protein [Amycolatopsis cihanbeyliensis]